MRAIVWRDRIERGQIAPFVVPTNTQIVEGLFAAIKKASRGIRNVLLATLTGGGVSRAASDIAATVDIMKRIIGEMRHQNLTQIKDACERRQIKRVGTDKHGNDSCAHIRELGRLGRLRAGG